MENENRPHGVESPPLSAKGAGSLPPSRRHVWLRRLAWGLGGVLLAAALVGGGAYAWVSLTLSRANNQPGVAEARQALKETLTTLPASGTSSGATSSGSSSSTSSPPAKPGAMNILLLGADKVPGVAEKYGRSDTMMLVHVDPQANFVSILSLPRDLKIDLGSHGAQKLNAAYAFGGDALAIRTIRQLTGLPITHYVKIDFNGFQTLTKQLGGFWVDVDRRYFYAGDVYEPINLQAGYQRLSGLTALQYVRFRHDLNVDWARIQRQQTFLRAVKEQVFAWNVATRLPGAVSALMKYVSTEIGPNDALKLAWWAAHLDMSRVKQVVIAGSAQYIGGIAYVVSSNEQIQAAVSDLMTPPAPAGVPSSTTAPAPSTAVRATKISLSGIPVEVRGGPAGEPAGVAHFLSQHGAKLGVVSSGSGQLPATSSVTYPAENDYSLVAEGTRVALALGIHKLVEDNSLRRVVVVLGADFVPPDPAATVTSVEAAEWKYLAGASGLLVEAPGWLPADYNYSGSRTYDIDTGSGKRPALKVTYKLHYQDQYLGIMETTFANAPAAAPGEQVTQSGTVFTVVSAGGTAERVWWVRNGVLYWVSNTLGSALTREELLHIAESMKLVS
jgi:LCP family protein required for cell wall assembly